MNILIVGCGKVGSQLANVLSKMGHDVSIVDPDEERFSNLSDEFAGYTVTGVPIDQDVLRKAGIEGCEALAAVSNDDNMNVMVCQIASEIFHVPKVLARIYDPARGDVFSHFGLHTVCPTNLSVDALYSMLTDGTELKICIWIPLPSLLTRLPLQRKKLEGGFAIWKKQTMRRKFYLGFYIPTAGWNWRIPLL